MPHYLGVERILCSGDTCRRCCPTILPLKLFCGDAELSSKDWVLQDRHSQVLGGLSGQARTDLIQAENGWVGQRNQCRDPGMTACIAQSYDARIRELKAAAPPLRK
jgi:uncharacterized protein